MMFLFECKNFLNGKLYLHLVKAVFHLLTIICKMNFSKRLGHNIYLNIIERHTIFPLHPRIVRTLCDCSTAITLCMSIIITQTYDFSITDKNE